MPDEPPTTTNSDEQLLVRRALAGASIEAVARHRSVRFSPSGLSVEREDVWARISDVPDGGIATVRRAGTVLGLDLITIDELIASAPGSENIIVGYELADGEPSRRKIYLESLTGHEPVTDPLHPVLHKAWKWEVGREHRPMASRYTGVPMEERRVPGDLVPLLGENGRSLVTAAAELLDATWPDATDRRTWPVLMVADGATPRRSVDLRCGARLALGRAIASVRPLLADWGFHPANLRSEGVSGAWLRYPLDRIGLGHDHLGAAFLTFYFRSTPEAS